MTDKVIENENVFKEYLTRGAYFTENYEFPILEKVDFKPQKAIPFDKAKTSENFKQWVHFYIEDRNFECLWNNPNRYLARLKKFEGVITTDYSLYRMLPLAFQIWNTYRNRVIAYWLQNNGINIVPNIRWGDERTYKFAFDGIDQGGTVAISTNGCLSDNKDIYYFLKGLKQMVKVLKPETIINYSQTPDEIFLPYKKRGIEIITIENYHLTVRKEAK